MCVCVCVCVLIVGMLFRDQNRTVVMGALVSSLSIVFCYIF